ncbi:gamma-aminobutyric acid receptor subunit gamma-4 [Nematostella vectensis]|uniref:gamma-aminobutyric acid receptor subunit gamma-4 n=1 Tax=Nematostella vectensis TaxID=45351 RepID=UPI0020774CE7|nr:gamma-aminobutyric acid receptor subunit gamma-4 [Nematostella vectensis]
MTQIGTCLLFFSGFLLNTGNSYSSSNCFDGGNRTAMDLVYCVENQINYSKASRPARTNTSVEKTTVMVDVAVLALGINEAAGEFSLDIFLRQGWHDHALTYDAIRYNKTKEFTVFKVSHLIIITLSHMTPRPFATTRQRNSQCLNKPPDYDYALTYDAKTIRYNKTKEFTVFKVDLIEKIWTPDTYIDNSKDIRTKYGHGALTNEGLRIYPDGRVFRSTRLSMSLYCQMEFHWFPLDIQDCYLNISSYFHPAEHLVYHWRHLSIDNQIKIPKFELSKVLRWENLLKFSTGNFSALTVGFRFRREVYYYLFRFYIPASLTVVMSWVSFWISPLATPARISLTIITVLAMAGFLIGDHPDFPKSSYARSFDVYMMMCFVFVFGCLVEYAAVHYLLRDDKYNKKNDINRNPNLNKIAPATPSAETALSTQSTDQCTNRSVKLNTNESNRISATRNGWRDNSSMDVEQAWGPPRDPPKASCLSSLRRRLKAKQISGKLDEISRILFPVMFILFNTVYWVLNLNMNHTSYFPSDPNVYHVTL